MQSLRSIVKHISDSRIAQLELQQIRFKAEIWELRDVPGNALRYYLDYAKSAQSMMDSVALQSALGGVIENLAKASLLQHADVTDITAFANSLPGEFSVSKEKLLQMLRNKPTI